jgi:hypothetical protein
MAPEEAFVQRLHLNVDAAVRRGTAGAIVQPAASARPCEAEDPDGANCSFEPVELLAETEQRPREQAHVLVDEQEPFPIGLPYQAVVHDREWEVGLGGVAPEQELVWLLVAEAGLQDLRQDLLVVGAAED